MPLSLGQGNATSNAKTKVQVLLALQSFQTILLLLLLHVLIARPWTTLYMGPTSHALAASVTC